MAQHARFVQEGVDRVRETVSSFESDIERMQKRAQEEFNARRKAFERQLAERRKSFAKQTEKRVRKLRTELRKNSVVKRAQDALDDATRQLEKGIDNLFEALHVASKRDLNRIDRKLSQINRKLRDLEKVKPGNGAAKAS